MLGFIDSGFEHLEPLVAFRDWLQTFSKDTANRMLVRRSGAPGMGPLTMEARAEVLRHLEDAQAEIGLPLISDAEVQRIHEIWREDVAVAVLRKADQIIRTLEDA